MQVNLDICVAISLEWKGFAGGECMYLLCFSEEKKSPITENVFSGLRQRTWHQLLSKAYDKAYQ